MYAKIAHSRVFLHLYLIRSSNTFVNNMLFKQKLNTREDRVIKAICGSYLGWPDNSWEKQPTINYFGKVSKESSDQPSLTISSQAWEWKWNHDFFFKIADLTCQCDSENASCKVLQDLHSGRWGPVSLQHQKASKIKGKLVSLFTTGMKPAFNFNDEQLQRDEESMYAKAKEQWRVAQDLKLVGKTGIKFPAMVSRNLWMFLQKRTIFIAHKMWVVFNLMAVKHLYAGMFK